MVCEENASKSAGVGVNVGRALLPVYRAQHGASTQGPVLQTSCGDGSFVRLAICDCEVLEPSEGDLLVVTLAHPTKVAGTLRVPSAKYDILPVTEHGVCLLL
jgi:hypothetical protein